MAEPPTSHIIVPRTKTYPAKTSGVLRLGNPGLQQDIKTLFPFLIPKELSLKVGCWNCSCSLPLPLITEKSKECVRAPVFTEGV